MKTKIFAHRGASGDKKEIGIAIKNLLLKVLKLSKMKKLKLKNEMKIQFTKRVVHKISGEFY